MLVPLGVGLGLNELDEPHDGVGVQPQFTPALAVSFVTVAAAVVVPEIATVAAGAVEMETEMAGGGGAVIVTCAVAFFVVSVTDVAVSVTVPPVGTALGAVYTVLLPLGVEVGLKVPHALAGVQLQFTPALALSFVTVTDTPTLLPAAIVEGGAAKKFTEIG